MEDDIINIPQVDIEKLIKQWQLTASESQAVVEMTKTRGWQIIEKRCQEMIEDVAKAIIDPGISDQKTLTERILTARAAKKILDIIRHYEQVAERASKEIKRLKEKK